jgi:hypothetical protein
MTRQVLPSRRYAETVTLNFALGEYKTPFQVSVGYFDYDRKVITKDDQYVEHVRQPAEVFIMGAKAGSSVESVARDASVILSIALQYGAPVEVLQQAITRNPDGTPSTIMGAVLDHLAGTTKDAPGEPPPIAHWGKLPLDLRQRYRRETDYAKNPPSQELQQAIADAVKAIMAEEGTT